MYAVVKTGGKQYRVVAGDKLKVEQIPADVGAEGPALVVRVESADVPVVVPERRAPRSSPSPSPKAEPPSLPAVEKKQ